MKNAIILHGKPNKDEYYATEVGSPSNMHWLPWAQRQLIVRDILAQTPELPRPYEPEYDAWREVFEQFMINDQTILVGHSCGAGFLVRWLSENDTKVGKVVLVAPSLGMDWDARGMFDFPINPDISTRTGGISIIVAKDDRGGIQQAVSKIRDEVKEVKVRQLESGGHFTFKDMKTTEFPELLEEVLA